MSEINYSGLKTFGKTALEMKHDALVDAVKAVTLNSGLNYRLSRNATGTTLVLNSSKSAGVSYPFDIAKQDATAKTIKFKYGIVNGRVPQYIFTDISYDDSTTQYVKIACESDGNSITSASLIIDNSQPDLATPTMTHAPTSFDVLLYVMVSGTPYRVWGNGNVTCSIVEAFRTDKASPSLGSSPYDIWYTWNMGVS